MKVFMSWSGDRSRATAELLRDWIKCVLQASRPWISSRDIDRGTLWFSEINNNLQDTSVGIVCLTGENKNRPWILFEAGALAKGLSTSRVCTFLVDLKTSDLDDPLRQFNHTLPTRESVFALVTTLNSAFESNALDPRILLEVFNTYWPQFETKFATILADIPAVTVIEVRPPDEMLAEILDSTRGLSSKIRSIEERLNMRGHSAPSQTQQTNSSELANALSKWQGQTTPYHSSAVFAAALQAINKCQEAGMDINEAMIHLPDIGIGKKQFKEMWELIADARMRAPG